MAPGIPIFSVNAREIPYEHSGRIELRQTSWMNGVPRRGDASHLGHRPLSTTIIDPVSMAVAPTRNLEEECGHREQGTRGDRSI
jgi:hypothetical protein